MEKIDRIGSNVGRPGQPTGCALAALVVFLGGWLPCAQGAILTIDDFTQPGPATFFHLPAGNNQSMTLSQLIAGAFGGDRDTTINVVGTGKSNSATGLIGHDTDFDVNAMQIQTNGLAPAITTVMYSLPIESVGAGPAGAHPLPVLAGVDLTDGGKNNQFLLQFLYVDAMPNSWLDFTITITDSNGHSSTTKMETAHDAQSTYNLLVPFSDLAGSASVTDVESIKYVFNAVHMTPNVDYVVQLLGTTSVAVPEPASGILMAIALGLGGLGVRRARRQRRPCEQA